MRIKNSQTYLLGLSQNQMPRSYSSANPSTDWKKLHATTSLIQTLLALAHWIILAFCCMTS